MEYITICNLVMGCEAVERAAGICKEGACGGMGGENGFWVCSRSCSVLIPLPEMHGIAHKVKNSFFFFKGFSRFEELVTFCIWPGIAHGSEAPSIVISLFYDLIKLSLRHLRILLKANIQMGIGIVKLPRAIAI